ncbi:MAG: Gfo/Idh/MocA family protein [Anaerolineae bacterium]
MADNNNHASRPVRIGIIGYGYWGPNLTRNFTEINSSEVVVVADFDADRLAAMRSKYPGVQTTATYQDFWDMDLDAVVVATPPPTHYAIAKDCLEHGLHVLVEKPITLNSAHAEELIALAEAKDLRLMVGHTFEYNAAVRKMKAIIESGELGEI